jgi:hypothetical protein
MLLTLPFLVLFAQSQSLTLAPPIISPSRTFAPPTTSPSSTTSPTAPGPEVTRAYPLCGGFRITPSPGCPTDTKCMDDPRSSGCGMACDMPGICVPNDALKCGGELRTSCPVPPPGGVGEIVGEEYFRCYRIPRGECDVTKGDCEGICLRPPYRRGN